MFRSPLNLPQRYTPLRREHNVAKSGNLLPFFHKKSLPDFATKQTSRK